MKYLLCNLAVLATLLVSAQAANGENIVLNGNFGTGQFTNWTVTHAADSSLIVVGSQITPPSGDTYEAEFGAGDGYDDSISQTLKTIAGDSYTFSFSLAHSSSGAYNDFSAYWDGNPAVLSLSRVFDAVPWTAYMFAVTATGASTTITFSGRDAGSSGLYALDDVSVADVTPHIVPPAPEPSALAALFGLGGAGIVGFVRRRCRGA